MKMASSSASFLSLLVCVGVVALVIAQPDDRECSIERYGKLTMFNEETVDVKLPCKYRLADFTCGDYEVKVTPGSSVDPDSSHRFSPATVWVKVVNTKTNETLKITTSVERLEKYGKGEVRNAWDVKGGPVSVVDTRGYDTVKKAAVLGQQGVFLVEFSSAEHSVVVTCSDKFVSQELPESLCGNGITNAPAKERQMTDDAFISTVVLNHTKVVQSPACKDLASKFKSCDDKGKAAKVCAEVFGSYAKCLSGSGTSLRDHYADCLTSVCDDDPSAAEAMNNYIKENCLE